MEYRKYKVIYRRYASLYFIVGVDQKSEENELGILEFIHCLVECLDKYFKSVVRIRARARACVCLSFSSRCFSLVRSSSSRSYASARSLAIGMFLRRCLQCELDIMFNIEIAHLILNEMVLNGEIVDTNKKAILNHVRMVLKSRK